MGRLDNISVVVFCKHYSGLHTGGRLYAHLMTHALAAEGAKVTLSTEYFPSYHDYFKDIPGHDSIEIIHGRNYGGAKRLKQVKADIAIGVQFEGAGYARWFKEQKKVPFILFIYDTPNWMKQAWVNPLEEFTSIEDKMRRVNISAKKADRIVYLSIEARKWGIEYFKDYKVKEETHQLVLYPAINQIIADQVKQITPFEVRQGACFISRLCHYKRPDMAIEICGLANIRHLTMIGWDNLGQHSDRLIKLAREKGVELHLYNNMDEKEKFKVIQNSKMLLATTTFEGYGLPIEEALYMNTPAIVYSNVPVFKEIFVDRVHYANTTEQFAELAKTLNKDKKFWLSKQDKNRDVITRNNFSRYCDALAGVVLNTLNNTGKVSVPITNTVIPEKVRLEHKTKISILMPLYKPDYRYLNIAINSIFKQFYTNWELCIGMDGEDKELEEILETYKKSVGNKIKWKVQEHDGIAKATSTAMNLATGNYWAFMDGDDVLEPNALLEFANLFETNPNLKMAYSNERQITGTDSIIGDRKKPDWSPEFFRQEMFINHMKIFRAKEAKKVGYPRKEYGGSQDYDWALRFTELCKPNEVGHIPKVLYNWRIHGKNISSGHPERQWLAFVYAKKAVEDHMKRIGLDAKLWPLIDTGNYHVRRNIHGKPKVLIILLTNKKVGMFKKCLDAIERETSYDNYDIQLMHHTIESNEVMDEMLDVLPYPVIKIDEPFNFAKFHNKICLKNRNKYDYFVIINDDIIVNRDWLSEMLGIATQDKKVGVVGAKLLYPYHKDDFREYSYPLTYYSNQGILQHGGVNLVKDLGGCRHRYYQKAANSLRINYIDEVDAVTFALCLIKANLFNHTKLDEELHIDYNDVDFCLQIKQKGYKTMYCPWALAWHFESATRPKKPTYKNVEYFRKKWANLLKQQPTTAQRLIMEEQGL